MAPRAAPQEQAHAPATDGATPQSAPVPQADATTAAESPSPAGSAARPSGGGFAQATFGGFKKATFGAPAQSAKPAQGGGGEDALVLSPWAQKKRLERAVRNVPASIVRGALQPVEDMLFAIKLTKDSHKQLQRDAEGIEESGFTVAELREAMEEVAEDDSWTAAWDAFWGEAVYRGDRLEDEDGNRNSGVFFVDAPTPTSAWELVPARGEYGYGVPAEMTTVPLSYARAYLREGHLHMTIADCSSLPEDCELYPLAENMLARLRRIAANARDGPPPANAWEEVPGLPWRMSRTCPGSDEIISALLQGSSNFTLGLGSAFIGRWQPDWTADAPPVDLSDSDTMPIFGPVRQPAVKAAE